ncbi:hypothetical protein PAP_08575 [Palaeococcus pacificus DY20341]|uniref:DUF2202 domain-containing protein n=1 Tax=Palaeococcus pacificus DY20341 TaxID=1343739 RepID=A0A075LVE8_9EURY|nr:DUF2202 domain-containing protein [Palaeococcus pacificus]AIF70096.1 hypothetical protein PAP_08575 [Palaeococcus pacificus DY20341]
MRKKLLGIGLLGILFGVILGSVAAMPWWAETWDKGQAVEDRPYIGIYETSSLSQEEIDGLLYMREEEKLARDVYLTLYEMYGLPVFQNIAQSEQTHTDAILSLIEKYNLTDPAVDEVGVFTNPELQELYDQLIVQGSQSLEDALKVGALIEEVDIKDLEEWIAKTDNADIIQVYESLISGSESHLRAFTRTLSTYGVSYEPQVISEEQYQEIVSSSMSRGQMGRGMKGFGGRR